MHTTLAHRLGLSALSLSLIGCVGVESDADLPEPAEPAAAPFVTPVAAPTAERAERADEPSNDKGTGGSAAQGFTYIDSSEANGPDFFFIDISDTGTDLGFEGWDQANVAIPFVFPYYGTNYNSVRIGSEGGIFFNGSILPALNTAIPGTPKHGVTRHIAVFWDNLQPSQGGQVFYEVRGAAPDRRLIVQWHEVVRKGQNDAVTAQAILFEGTGNILMQYLDPTLSGGLSATVGVQSSTSQGVQYSFNEPVIHGGLAICWTPTGGSATDCDVNGNSYADYTFTDSNQPGAPQYFWEEISDSGTYQYLGTNSKATITPGNGFTFPFAGQNHSSLTLGTNGVIAFDSGNVPSVGQKIPNDNGSNTNRFIALYWDNLAPWATGSVYYEVRGQSPNRRLIVQWNKVQHRYRDAQDSITAQAVLFETTGNILLQYLNPSVERGAGATVGVQLSASSGLQYSYLDPSLRKNTAICFVPAGGNASDCSVANWLSRKGAGSAAEAGEYYNTINAPSTFSGWKSAYGFGTGDEIRAVYYNNFDLGLGRDMNCREGSNQSGDYTACYVTNYGIAPGGPAQTAINHALAGISPIATVAMVKLDAIDGSANDVQFMVYSSTGALLQEVALDSEGAKAVPQVCLICHGGTYDSTNNAVNGSSFLPFDVFTYIFSESDSSFSLPSQEEALRQLNLMVKDSNPDQPIVDIIDGMYATNGGVSTVGATAADDFTPSGWSGDPELYHKVVKTSCRGCHAAQVNWTFTSEAGFYDFMKYQVCDDRSMPHAEKPSKNFWNSDGPYLPAYLSAKLGWSKCLDEETDGPVPSSFSRVTGSTEADIIDAIFHIDAPAPRLPFGSLVGTDTFTTTPDSGYHKLLLAFSDTSGVISDIDTTVVGESSVKLTSWYWYDQTWSVPDLGDVWTSNGWEAISDVGISSAELTSGKYFYRIELADRSVNHTLATFIAADSAADVRFYTH